MRESTLREHTRRGLIPCIRIGRLVRYSEADLDAWLEGIKVPAIAPRS